MSPGQQPITSIHRDDIITASSSDCRRVTGALKCQEGGGGGGSSSREQGSSNRTWSRSSTGSGSPGSQVAPAAPPAGEAEPEKDSE